MSDGWLATLQNAPWSRKVIGWLNIRSEEIDRTFLLFAFYTVTSIGVLWLEVGAAALFLGEYGAESLPWIYLASAGIGTGLGFLYSTLQKLLPLRRVIVLTAILMALPLLLFRLELNPAILGGYSVFLMRLWLEAIYVLNELNTSITANQLFNIREIKRTYPLVSSGILVADVLSGFSLPLLRSLVGLPNIILLASLMLLVGAGILAYICQTFQQFFPDSRRRRLQEQSDGAARRLRGPLRRYVVLLVTFFVMAQVLSLLIDFQYLSQLEQNLNVRVEDIADFLALFSGILGLFELLTQWFISSRAIERLGVFVVATILPGLIVGLSLFSLSGLMDLFLGLIVLKFLDELLRYTLLASTGPVLFQPIPDAQRSRIQSVVRGIAEPISTGLTGLAMLATIWLSQHLLPAATQGRLHQTQSLVFLVYVTLLAAIWLVTVLLLRSRYTGLLVLSAERGDLSLADVDPRSLRRAVLDTLERPSAENDKASSIELLSVLDPKAVGEVLAPLLPTLTPTLQRQALEEMLKFPNPIYLDRVRSLLQNPLPPDVFAVALRYVWLTEANPDLSPLQDYLQSEVDPAVRGTAASLLLRRGDPQQKAIATDTLRRMLTHDRERERVMGCRALGEAEYLQALRLYIKPLLQDSSLRVRCAMLEAIAATHSEEYYPSLLRGLQYKSTRDAALRALVRLDNDAIPLLVQLGEDLYQPELVRTCALTALGQIGSPEALIALVAQLMTAWGPTRRNILRILVKLPQDLGVDAVFDILGRTGVESLINQELLFVGQLYAAIVDFDLEETQYREVDLLCAALRDQQSDAIERLFLLMRLLYHPSSAIQAAAFNLQSNSPDSMARGLEILDNTLDIASKRVLLVLLDRRPDREKLESLSEATGYESMQPSQRLRHLLELRYFLSDWTLACCFHLARQHRWSLTTEQTLAGLRHPTGFVRESVLTYLKVASPRALLELLPLLKADPHRLVVSQVEAMMSEFNLAVDVNYSNGAAPGSASVNLS